MLNNLHLCCAVSVFCFPFFLGTSVTDFSPQLKNLNKDIFTLIAWDPPGYGKSYPPPREWVDDFLQEDAKIAARLMEVCKMCHFNQQYTVWNVGR